MRTALEPFDANSRRRGRRWSLGPVTRPAGACCRGVHGRLRCCTPVLTFVSKRQRRRHHRRYDDLQRTSPLPKVLRMSGRLAKSLAMAGTALMMLGLAVSAAHASPGDADVYWQMLCTVDHFGPNDPIVFPDEPGRSHMHSFYGNTSTNADSTAASLMAAPSSCGRNMGTSDHSAYWIPSLYKKNADGSFTLVKDPNQLIIIYYRRPGGSSGPKVQPLPLGLAMVAGNARATSPQSQSVVVWDCGGGGPVYPSIPQCPTGASTTLHADIVFPSCWDGTQLDSPDHMSNMAYANPDTGACPADHPVSLPQVEFSIFYNIAGGALQYELSSQLSSPSHSPYTMHGDFFAAWDPQVQNALVAACLNAGQDCLNVYRDGGNLIAGDNSQITITLADYPATSQTVAPTPTTPAPTKSAHARKAASTRAKPSARAIMPAIPATTRSAPSTLSTRATRPSRALSDTGQVGLAGGAIGLSLLAFAVYRLRRRRRVQHDRLQRWD